MRMLRFVALFAGLGASFSGGQQTVSAGLPPVQDSRPARVKVYVVGPDVTAPDLIPPNLAPITTGNCKKKVDGKVVLSVLVDATGNPRNIMFLKPLGSDLDKLALKLVSADRFNPGIHNGTPVAVGQSVEVAFQACVDEKKDDVGKNAYLLRMRSQPVQTLGNLPEPPEEIVPLSSPSSWNNLSNSTVSVSRVGGRVTAPVVLNSPEAQYSDEAKSAKFQGICLISLIIDANGMPQNIQVIKKLGYGLDEKAIEAVSKYRFKPAMKDGQPVPVMQKVEIEFHLY